MLKKYNDNFLLTPCPTVLVTTKLDDFENIITISWAGIVCSHPEYVSISINPKRYSFDMIMKTKKFCINIPSIELLEKVDFCGSNSGKDIDKFIKCNFSKSYVDDFVLINECEFFILCDVEHILNLGSHYLFVAKVLSKYVNDRGYQSIHDQLNPIVYYRPYYYKLDLDKKGCYGYTRKNKK